LLLEAFKHELLFQKYNSQLLKIVLELFLRVFLH